MINRINCLLVVAGAAMLLNACIEHRDDVRTHTKLVSGNKEEEKYIADKDYKVFRIYEGEVPCEDCDGIQQRLVIKGDTAGIFRLTETYRNATEDGDATLVCSGEWKRIKTQTNRRISKYVG